MINKPLIIAIDGLSGVGKGTLARSLADRLGLPYLDTGILYRVVTRKMLDSGLKPDDADTIKIAENLDEKDWQRSDLRTPEVDRAVSQVAAQIPIRRALLDMQRRFAAKKGAVMDGRDIGTVIFPSAQVKLFITASSRIRAERRWLQYTDNSQDPTREDQIDKIESDLIARDEADSKRAVAPLRPAEDAIILQTDKLSAEAVLEEALTIIKKRLK